MQEYIIETAKGCYILGLLFGTILAYFSFGLATLENKNKKLWVRLLATVSVVPIISVATAVVWPIILPALIFKYKDEV